MRRAGKTEKIGRRPAIVFAALLCVLGLLYTVYLVRERGFAPSPRQWWTIHFEQRDGTEVRVEEYSLRAHHDTLIIKVCGGRQWVSAYSGDSLVYEYAPAREGDTPKRGIHAIPIQAEYLDEPFRLELTSPFAGENHLMNENIPSVQDANRPVSPFVNDYTVGIACVVLGLSALVVAFMSSAAALDGREQYLLALAAILHGVFALSSSSQLLLMLPPRALYWLYWGSFFLYPLALNVLLTVLFGLDRLRWMWGATLVPGAYALVCALLDALHILPIAYTEFWYTSLQVACVLFLTAGSIAFGYRPGKRMKTILLVLFALTCGWLLSFFLRKVIFFDITGQTGVGPQFSNEVRVVVILWITVLYVSQLLKYCVRLGEVKHNEEHARQKSEMLLSYYGIVEEQAQQTTHLRHELRHHFLTLGLMYEDGQYTEMGDYVKAAGAQYAEKVPLTYSENYLLQVLLNYTQTQCRRLGFDMEYQVSASKKLNVSEADLASLLLNLVENALESCEDIPEPAKRWMRVAIKEQNGLFYIEVSNACRSGVKRNGNRFLSTKQGDRGYGLLVLDKIAKKYAGFVKPTVSGDAFSVQVVLNAK